MGQYYCYDQFFEVLSALLGGPIQVLASVIGPPLYPEVDFLNHSSYKDWGFHGRLFFFVTNPGVVGRRIVCSE